VVPAFGRQKEDELADSPKTKPKKLAGCDSIKKQLKLIIS